MQKQPDLGTSVANPRRDRLPAFIIGLPSAYRGVPLEHQLADLQVCWKRIDGVIYNGDGNNDGVVDRLGARALLGRDILAAEVGCALAHRKVYEEVLSSAHPAVIVFEDDARLLGDLPFEEISKALHTSQPTVVMLSYKYETAFAYRKSTKSRNREVGYLRALVPPTTTTAYALNKSAAEILQDGGRPITHVADWPVGPAAKIHFLLPQRPLAEPDASSHSTIPDRTSNGEHTPGSSRSRIMRRVSAISHVTWLRHSVSYGSYKAYIMHEFVRKPTFLRRLSASTEDAERTQVSLDLAGLYADLVGRLWK